MTNKTVNVPSRKPLHNSSQKPTKVTHKNVTEQQNSKLLNSNPTSFCSKCFEKFFSAADQVGG